MKYFIGILAVVVVIAGVAVFRSHSGTSPVAQQNEEYRLAVIAGVVSLQHPDGAASTPVTDTALVVQGDRIVTSATGRARLTWPNGTITTLESNSDITLDNLSNQGNRSRITLNLGDIWSKVSRILGADEYYEVKTKETVAAVRGTLFRSIYRNNHTVIQGVENTVRVFARNQDGTTDETSGTDVIARTLVDVDPSILTKPPGSRHLTARALTEQELKDPILQRIKNEFGSTISPSPTASPTSTPTTTPKRSSSPSTTPTPTQSPSPTAAATHTPSPVVTPTMIPVTGGIPPISSILPLVSNLPSSVVTLKYVAPTTVAVGANFMLKGTNFITGRNTPLIHGVLIGYQSAEFHIIDASTIFVTVPQMAPGTYEITVSTVESTLVNLTPGVTVQ